MIYALQIQDEAIIEIQKIFEGYENAKDGLGFEFIESLENAYSALSKGAKFYGFIDIKKIFRRISLDRFPCMVIYEIEDLVVIVVAVRFERENPEKRKQFSK